ncbi:unnamed protein product [Linum trigynum]|uniref:Uncharacterized protein n=1 Tax=Linum trigynum TaxID=586398 RepID=A0AAV2ESW2_9ROSI
MEEEVVVLEEEDPVVVMEEEVSQGTVRGNNMFSRMYSRKGRKKTVLPVVQELEVPAVTSTVDDVVDLVVKSTIGEVVQPESFLEPEVMDTIVDPVFQQSSSPAIVFDPVVQQMESSAIVSTFDKVVVSESIVQPIAIHYTDLDTTFHDVMQIAFQTTIAAEESIETSPTMIPVKATTAA